MGFIKRTTSFAALISLLIFLTFDLMVLGAGVRAMDAGLTCPDWPLCFGRVIPAYHLGVYFEFIHRAVAGIVALLFLVLYVKALRNPRYRVELFLPMTLAALLLVSQIIMGGLTVLNLLAYWTVTTHLALATAFLSCLVYVKFKVYNLDHPTIMRPTREMSSTLAVATLLAVFLVAGQMVLGGLVASTYSGLICVDFPTCNGQWFPSLTGFVGLQVWHRMGAYILVLFISGLFMSTRWLYREGMVSEAQFYYCRRAFFLIFAQVLVGVGNLIWLLPTWLRVLHSALAIMIFVSLLQAFLSRRSSYAFGTVSSAATH